MFPQTKTEGNDLFYRFQAAGSRAALGVTYWDLWMLLVITNNFSGDWDRFRDFLLGKARSLTRDPAEGYLNHLQDLRRRLDESGIQADRILARADLVFLRRQHTRAVHQLLRFEAQPREFSQPMINTPRRLRQERAMRGHWVSFPVNPSLFASEWLHLYKTKGYYAEDESFSLGRKLSSHLHRQKETLSAAGRLALYRSFLTVVLEKMNMVDDSYGVIGQMYGDALESYVALDRSGNSLPIQTFFLDLLELIIWEDMGMTDDQQPHLLASLARKEVPVVKNILENEYVELRQLGLDYQAERGLTMLGLLCATQHLWDDSLRVATLMGSREWKRIVQMAGEAEAAGRADVALAIFDKSFNGGRHESFLREKMEELRARSGL